MTETKGKFLGVALIARKKCGRIAAMAWTDAFRHSEIESKELEWKRLRLDVRREPRHENDPWPEWVGDCKSPCACKEGGE